MSVIEREEPRVCVSVRDVMRPVHVTTSPEESIGRAIEKMRIYRTRLLVVVHGGLVVGVVGERDLMTVRASARTPARVGDRMSRSVASAPMTISAEEATKLLADGQLDALAVLDGARVVVGTVARVPATSKRTSKRASYA